MKHNAKFIIRLTRGRPRRWQQLTGQWPTLLRRVMPVVGGGILLVTAGCENMDVSSRGLVDAGAAAGAGVIANQLSGGDLATTAIAAGAAGVGADLLQGAYHSNTKKQVEAGYDLGRSDATKQLYWASQRLQAPGASGEGKANYTDYEVPLPQQTIDGVTYKPTTKVLRINE